MPPGMPPPRQKDSNGLIDAPESGHADSILFSGNRNEIVPQALLLDIRLTPLERNAWQVFRMHLSEGGLSAFPTYQQLRRFLASTPCSGSASDETIARALTILRLTRWLTLARHRRDQKSGRILGNLYVLHDDPLTPYETVQLDPEYFELVSRALSHSSKAINVVGYHAIKEIADDPHLSQRVLPSRLQLLQAKISDDAAMLDAPSSESEEGVESTETPMPLRIPKPSTVPTNDSLQHKESTVLRTIETSLTIPEAFRQLPLVQKSGALTALNQLPADVRQAVLDEWSARVAQGSIQNPAGYLFGIIQKALRGEFRAWAGVRPPSPARQSGAKDAKEHCSRVDPAIARENVAKLRALLKD